MVIRSAARYLTSAAAALDGVTTFKAYEAALESRFHGLLDVTADPARPRDSVRLTWEISVDRLEQRGLPSARWIMRLLGELADAPLPAAVVRSEVLGRGPAVRLANWTVARHPRLFPHWCRVARVLLSRQASRPAGLDPAVGALVDVGLLDLDTAGAAPCVLAHPLVRRHNDALLAADKALHRSLFAAAAALVRSGIARLDPEDPRDFALLSMFAPHVEKLLSRCSADGSRRNSAAIADSGNVVCRALYGYGDYVRTYSLAALNVAFTRRHLRPGTRVSLAAEHAYCRALLLMGQAPTAIGALRQLAEQCRRRLGERDRDTLKARFNLAYAERETGQVDEASIGDLAAARRELDQVWPVCRSASRPEARGSSYAGRVLARTLCLMGLLPEAESVFHQLMRDASPTYGPDHPEVLDIRQGLAAARALRGHADEAMSMLEDIVAARTRLIGAGHPDTRRAAGELARLRTASDEGDALARTSRRRPSP